MEKRRIIGFEPSEKQLEFLDTAKERHGTPYVLTIKRALDSHIERIEKDETE